jgi:NAD(P)-dependent dehydrogenase (short-subunit alcohol dehydrogenase family)
LARPDARRRVRVVVLAPREPEDDVKSLQGEVAVVTGAASGIGRAVSERLAAEGMRVALADRNAAAVEEVADGLRATGATVLHQAVDVTQPSQLDDLRDRVLDEWGSVGLIMNNAGIGACGRVWELPSETWRVSIDVNLMGVVNGLRSFVPVLVEQDRGHVVNTASMGGLVAQPLWSPYVATKFAVAGLTESLFFELAEAAPGVGVSLLCPGPVATDFLKPESLASDHDKIGSSEAVRSRTLNAYTKGVEVGIPPARVAEAVVQGVLSNRFYILTHPEMHARVASRAADIGNGWPTPTR